MIDETDKKIISLLQKDLPLDIRPFVLLAGQAGVSEDQFLERVESMVEKGIIRRFGATLYHQEAGFSSNAMVAWVVPDDKINEAGRIMSEFREVTHCYHRRPQKDWKYNLYTMIHGDSRDECHKIARRMSELSGIEKYTLLFSEREFKKTSMEYY